MTRPSELDTETARPDLRIELFVRDVRRAAAFYRDVLGFEILRRGPTGYTSIGREGAVIGLNAIAHLPHDHPARPAPGDPLGRGVELVIVVADLEALHAHAAATAPASAHVSALVPQPWGLTDFRLLDPDGYYLRLTGPSPAG